MMIYDETTAAFIHRATKMLFEVMEEIKIPVVKLPRSCDRFIFKGKRWPINLVVFEGKAHGYFNHQYLQIGLNKRLMYNAVDSVIKDIIRHEVAHYITFIHHGSDVPDHGVEYKMTCADLGFSPEVALSTMNLDEANEASDGDIVSERVIEKVKKLMRLAQSANAHEAELATIKANEILLRHNIEMVGDKTESFYIDRLMEASRINSKMDAIYRILSCFVVRVVYNKGRKVCSLEVSGTKTNVVLARYISEFLDMELDRMWEEAKKESGLSGLQAKNAFFLGVSQGFKGKMKKAKSEMSEEDQKALVVVETRLDEVKKNLYKRLTTSHSYAGGNDEAQDLGHEKGRSLTIHQGLESSGNGKTLAIGYGK